MVQAQSADLLRHLLATILYRGRKAITDAGAEYASMAVGHGIRTPVEILSHISDLLVWSRSFFQDTPRPPRRVAGWDEETTRFASVVMDLDQALATAHLDADTGKKLLQGPLADALTHVGQLAMLRRWADSPLAPENYVKASIVAGRF